MFSFTVKGCICPEIHNGRKITSKLLFEPRETITFECAPGYVLKGNNTIECQSDSTWDLPVPLCISGMYFCVRFHPTFDENGCCIDLSRTGTVVVSELKGIQPSICI